MATNKPRFTITLDEELYKEVEDYRFANRFETKSDAMASLVKIGLEALLEEEKRKENNGK